MDKASYVRRVLASLLIFASLEASFPFILQATAGALACSRGGAGCGGAALVAASVLKPLIAVSFLLYLAHLSTRRASDIGLPSFYGLFVPLMMAVDGPFSLCLGAPWSYAFSRGAFSTRFPLYSCFSVLCIAMLCVARRDTFRGARTKAQSILLFLGACILFLALLRVLIDEVPIATIRLPREVLVVILLGTKRYAFAPMLAFGLVSSLVIHAEPLPDDAHPATVGPTRSRAGLRLNLKHVVIATAIASTLATVIDLASEAGPAVVIVLPFYLPFVLATMLVYLPIVCALFNLLTRRDALAVVLAVCALLPFGFWFRAVEDAREARRAELRHIADIPVEPMGEVPTALVVEGGRVDCRRLYELAPEIKTIVDQPWRGKPRAFDTEACSPDVFRHGIDPGELMDGLPETYILVARGNPVSFEAPPRAVFSTLGEPTEVRLISRGRDVRIAADYQVFDPEPMFPPVLTTMGWYRGSNEAPIEAVDAHETDLVIAAIAGRRTSGKR